MKKKIVRRSDVNVPEILGIDKRLSKIYQFRGISQKEELDISLNGMLHFNTLKDIDKASARIAKALINDETILIIGDFDADGATSSSLAVAALRAFGAKHVDFLVPNRFAFGYGLSKEIVLEAYKSKPDLLITVDNGISSIEGVNQANELGIDVVVTDHHLAGDELPNACAIVNPNQKDCQFPSKVIAGVGVIFYVMIALRAKLKADGYFDERGIKAPNMGDFLDLVALGTVADVVPLDKNNRIMVEQGLRRIRSGKMRTGIEALFNQSKKDKTHLKAQDLGFAIGPRLNAAGRLDDMSIGISCLLNESKLDAKNQAIMLDDLNQARKEIESQMKEEAFKVIDKLQFDEKSLPLGLCLYQESWHQGVIGIVAGRLKERYSRPVIVFAPNDDKTEIKGSARSISGINIRDVLNDVSTKKPGLIPKFGGHAMAAGLSLKPNDFKAFQKAFYHELTLHMDEKDCVHQILSDGGLEANSLNLDFAKVIERAGPWGAQFEEPLFDNYFNVLTQRIVGQNHLKVTLQLEDSDIQLDGIYFNIDADIWPNERISRVHAAYKLDVNRYMGREKVQLMIEHLEPMR